jgi:transposase InsO family protein
MTKYRKYDDDIKKLIVATRNPNLFPELSIPRTTALYWISNARKSRSKSTHKTSSQTQISKVAKELEIEKYKSFVISKIFREELRKKGLAGKKEIVDLVDKGKRKYNIPYTHFCRLLGIHVATFKDWRISVYGCSWKFKKCEINTVNDLLPKEKEEILRLLRDRNFSHYSLKSLCYYAKRRGLVYASVTTWYKYMKINGIIRDKNRRPKRKSRIGIRANRPNEIWHIDVTQFKLRGGRKVYLQAIVDNFSRCIVDYEITNNISAANTVSLINKTLKSSMCENIMSDAGTENINKSVRRIVEGRGLKHMVAKKTCSWTNSMVESVFAAIKRKRRDFLYETKFESVKRYIEETISEYNNTIPHSMLLGGTPLEVYESRWGYDEYLELEGVHGSKVKDRGMAKLDCHCA